MKVACLYHSDADGFASAFAAWVSLKGKHELLFEPVQYGEEPPKSLIDFNPDQVYILDFSYKAPVLREILEFFPNTVVIDHHKSAAEDLADFPEIEVSGFHEADGVQTPLFSGVRVFQENSGCVLAWLFFNPNDEIPELLHYVQDRDLWKFELEHSKEINAYIATLPFEFDVWADFFMPLAYDAGKAVLAFQNEQVRRRVEAAEMMDLIVEDAVAGKCCGTIFRSIPCTNASDNVSEVGDALCHAYPDAPFSMTYCDRPGGKRSYSLRSRNGFDVSEVAKAFAGGGHRGAAGFTLDAPKII